jgi:hypothetical protein
MCSPTYLDHNDLTSPQLPQNKLVYYKSMKNVQLYILYICNSELWPLALPYIINNINFYYAHKRINNKKFK